MKRALGALGLLMVTVPARIALGVLSLTAAVASPAAEPARAQAGGEPMQSVVRIAAEGLDAALTTSTGDLVVSHGGATWNLHGEHPGVARLGVGATTYAIGCPGGVPVSWSASGARLSGTGRIVDAAVAFRITFEARRGGGLNCRLDLTGKDVGKVDWVLFPASPVLADAASRVVVPQWLGLLVAPDGPDMRVRRTIWQRPLSMRFMGATQPTPGGDRSCIAIMKDSLCRSVDIWRRQGALGFEYLGEASHAERPLTRRSQTLEFQFLAGNYVAIARRYRDWMRRQPAWRTLATRERPGSASRLAGAQLFSHVPCDYGGDNPLKFVDLIPRLRSLKELGVERAIFHLGGWNRDGYDSHYPEILPANPRCGGNEGMRDLTAAIDEMGYVCAPHDDIAIVSTKTPSFDEKWIARAPNGVMHNGGVYREQQYHIATAEAQVHFAERNLPEVHRLFPRLHGYLFDVATSYPPLEDYAYKPPLPREDDIRRRAEVFHVARRNFAEFLMSESIVDWAITYLDAGFMAEEGYVHRGDGGWSLDQLHGEIVPLWELVFHDVMIGIRDASNHVNTKMETEDPFLRYLRIWLKTLRAGTLPPAFFSDDTTLNVLSGYRSGATASYGGWSSLDVKRLLATVSRASTSLGDLVYNAPMTNHEFVGGSLYHERTEFTMRRGKVTVLVNTALEPWSPDAETTLAPLGFLITGPGLLAYHAERIDGRTLTTPTLAVVKGDPRKGSRAQTFRAFGDGETH